MRVRLSRAHVVLIAAASCALSVAGCDIYAPTEPGTLARIVVTPVPTLFPLAQQQMTAVGYDAEGKEVAITPTWTVAAGGGTISEDGLFTAGSQLGTFTESITATSGDVVGRATVVVVAGPAASLSITPTSATLVVGGTRQFEVVARDVGGNVVATMPSWSVTAGGGTITPNGLFTAGSTPGAFPNTVSATAAGLTASATVVVQAGQLATLTISPTSATLSVGSSQQFTVVGRDAAQNVVPVTPTWSVVAGGGTITSTGMFTAGTVPGSFPNTVTATSGSITATASVTVTSGALATITVSPNPTSLAVGASQQFAAVGRDAAGNVLPITPVWSIASSGSGATITQAGVYTAGPFAGLFANEVIATSGGISGSATVSVSGGAPTNSGFLGSAARFGALAGAGVSCDISGLVNGPAADVGSSPTATITGFPDPCSVTGAVVAAGVAAAAQTDLTAAFTSLQSSTGCTDLSGVDLSNFGALNPLSPGCYSFSGAAALTGTLALQGTVGAQWTFVIGGALTVGDGSNVILSGGAIPDNVRWVVGTTATLGQGAHTVGNVLASGKITLLSGATLMGRALSRTGAVDMTAGGAVITKP